MPGHDTCDQVRLLVIAHQPRRITGCIIVDDPLLLGRKDPRIEGHDAKRQTSFIKGHGLAPGSIQRPAAAGRAWSGSAARPVRSKVRPETTSFEHLDGIGPGQAVALSRQVLVRSRDPRKSEDVSRSGHAVSGTNCLGPVSGMTSVTPKQRKRKEARPQRDHGPAVPAQRAGTHVLGHGPSLHVAAGFVHAVRCRRICIDPVETAGLRGPAAVLPPTGSVVPRAPQCAACPVPTRAALQRFSAAPANRCHRTHVTPLLPSAHPVPHRLRRIAGNHMHCESHAASIRSLAFSPIMIAAAFVFELIRPGMIEESQTRNPSNPRTRSFVSTTESAPPPMQHVPTAW